MNKNILRYSERFRSTALVFTAGAALAILSSSFARPVSNSQTGTYASDLRIAAERSPAEFTPDGDLEKPAWKRAHWEEFDHDASGHSQYPGLRTRVACLWSSTHLYVAFSARFDSLYFYEGEQTAKERWQLWDRDVVEVFVNPQPDRVNHYYEFEVAPNNQWIDLEIDKDKTPFNDASWDSHFEHVVHVDQAKGVWNTEIRIPLETMKVDSLHAGAQWRINFFRAAGKGDDEHRRFLAWSIIPEGKTFHVPTRFGILTFAD
jgi:Carbohydrate family 9 binding domain-like